MSDKDIKYALIKNGSIIVDNTIIGDPEYSLDGYYVVAINDEVFCQPEMYYNKLDGLFYYDFSLSTIYPPATESESS